MTNQTKAIKTERACPCGARLVSTNPRTRRRFCRDCAAKRLRESNAYSRQKARKGLPPREISTKTRNKHAVGDWVSRYLVDKACDCGESAMALLRFDGLPRHLGVERLISKGADMETVQTAMERSTIRCVRCVALRSFYTEHGEFSYRRKYAERPRDIAPLEATELPSRRVPPPIPQARKLGESPTVEVEVASPYSTYFPADEIWAESPPEEPANSGPEVNVGDVAPAVAVSNPVAEAAPRTV
jgi:hypothetical protein